MFGKGVELFFLIQFGILVRELNRLLGVRFQPGYASNDTPIGRSLEGVLRFHNSGECERRDFELARLTLFVKDLQEIEASNHDLFHDFKKKLKRDSSSDKFFGLRFEINIAASLIRTGSGLLSQSLNHQIFVLIIRHLLLSAVVFVSNKKREKPILLIRLALALVRNQGRNIAILLQHSS